MGFQGGRFGERWVLEVLGGGNWWVTGLGAGFVGESGGFVELSYCRQRARACNAGWVMWMLYPLFPLQPGVMDPLLVKVLLSYLHSSALRVSCS